MSPAPKDLPDNVTIMDSISTEEARAILRDMPEHTVAKVALALTRLDAEGFTASHIGALRVRKKSVTGEVVDSEDDDTPIVALVARGHHAVNVLNMALQAWQQVGRAMAEAAGADFEEGEEDDDSPLDA